MKDTIEEIKEYFSTKLSESTKRKSKGKLNVLGNFISGVGIKDKYI